MTKLTQRVCAVCGYDQTVDPTMILARWQDQTICIDCLDNRPGKAEAEAEAQGERRPLTQAAYRAAGGGSCPTCQSDDVYAGRGDYDSGVLHVTMTCLDCDRQWRELYRLAGYIREGEAGDDDWEAFLDTAVVERGA
jgi:hypothetical protein